MAVTLIDLDRFKAVNDTLGHEAGDEVLREMARRLESLVRLTDTAARLGGDEFVVVSDLAAPGDGAQALAERLLERLSEPVALESGPVVVTPSLGIAVYPRDGIEGGELLRKADVALYRAKEEGRAVFRLFDELVHARAVRRLRRESQLRLSVERGELEVVYQPQLGRERLQGVEALVRWRHPDDGLLTAREFVPLLESTGTIGCVERRVLEEAATHVCRWRAGGLPELRLAVNLSPRALGEPEFAAAIEAILAAAGLPPSALDVEITERLLLQDPSRARLTLDRLAATGARIALDDFGTGYASLAYLKSFPVIRLLKVDTSFVQGIETSGHDRSIIRAVVALAHDLGLEVAAEGCESLAQVRFLGALGCDSYQGFLFSGPVSAADLPARAAALPSGASGFGA